MFRIGKRKRFNAVIDTKLNNEYQINTQNNIAFPQINAYLNLLDMAWNNKMTEDEGALYIATLYCCGIIKKDGYNKESSKIMDRIDSILDFSVPKGLISKTFASRCLTDLNKTFD